jgi:cobalt-precorrin 5A hydrolase
MKIAGIGFRAGASEASLVDALEKAAGARENAAGGLPLDALATLEDKMENRVIRALAARFGLPVIAIPRARLAGIETLTYSPRVASMLGTGSAAEALALAPLRPGARLVGPRALSQDRMASAAIATGEFP